MVTQHCVLLQYLYIGFVDDSVPHQAYFTSTLHLLRFMMSWFIDFKRENSTIYNYLFVYLYARTHISSFGSCLKTSNMGLLCLSICKPYLESEYHSVYVT